MTLSVLADVFQSEGRAALTSGPGVPTFQQVDTTATLLWALDAAELSRRQHEWNRPGVQFSVQSWSPFAQPGSVAALDPAGNLIGSRDSYSS